MSKGSGNKAWNQFIRFEKSIKETYVEVKINTNNGTNLFEVRCHGADAELVLAGQGEGGEDKVEFTVKLDSIQSQVESYVLPDVNNFKPGVDTTPNEKDVKATSLINLDSPNSKYRTTTVHFNVENAPAVKLYCIDNYNWELHVNVLSENVYQIYNFNLKVGGYTSDYLISLLEGQGWKPICEFRQRFFSFSSAKAEFKSEVTMPILKLLMTVMAYFRYSHYGKKVTIDGIDPNTFNSAEYNKEVEQRRKDRMMSEGKSFKEPCYNPSCSFNTISPSCSDLRHKNTADSYHCNHSHKHDNIHSHCCNH